MKKQLKGLGKGFLWSTRSISLSANAMLVGFLTIFCTDTLGLNIGVIGTLLLVAKVVDAISNFVFAYIVDNAHFKSGKGRPFEILLIPAWLITFLMFGIPMGWNTAIQYGAVFVLYTLIVSVFHTALYCTEPIYLNHAIKDQGDRMSIQTVNGMITVASFMGVGIALPIMMGKYYGQPDMWMKISYMIGIPCMLIGFIRYLFFKEVDTDEVQAHAQKITIADAVKGMTTNKYVLMIASIYFVVNFAAGLGNAATYYFTYIVGDVEKLAIVNSFGFVAFIIMPICGILAGKMDKSKIMALFLIVGAIGNGIRFFAGTNMFLLTLGAVVGGVVTHPVAIFGNLMLIDCMDFGEWKNKKRIEGAIFAATGLGSSIGTGVGNAALGIILGALGYDGMAATQSSAALFGIRLTYSLIPLVVYVLAAVVMLVYDLEKKLPTIRKELAERNSKSAATEMGLEVEAS